MNISIHKLIIIILLLISIIFLAKKIFITREGNFIDDAVNEVRRPLEDAFNKIKEEATKSMNILAQIPDKIKSGFDFIKTGFDTVKNFFDIIPAQFNHIIASIGEKITGVVDAAETGLTGVVHSVETGLTGVVNEAKSGITKVVNEAEQAILGPILHQIAVMEAIGDHLKKAFANFGEGVELSWSNSLTSAQILTEDSTALFSNYINPQIDCGVDKLKNASVCWYRYLIYGMLCSLYYSIIVGIDNMIGTPLLAPLCGMIYDIIQMIDSFTFNIIGYTYDTCYYCESMNYATMYEDQKAIFNEDVNYKIPALMMKIKDKFADAQREINLIF